MSNRIRVRGTALVVTAALAITAVAFSSAQSAGAATVQEQARGRFLDGAVGNQPLQSIADLADAYASRPGTTSVQNPLDANVLQKIDLPLTGALQLPGGGAFTLGAANQVAVTNADGSSYGASGAVANSGGLSVGGANGSFPADATIDLSPAALNSLSTNLPSITLPGGASLAALGGVTARIGAVSALAQTSSAGVGSTSYNVANLTLTVASPALGSLLKTLTTSDTSLTALLAPAASLLGSMLPAGCAITPGTLPSAINLDNGTVVIDPSSGSLTIDLEALLETLHLQLNTLPANTDLIAYLLQQLPTILSSGLEGVVNGIVAPLQTQFAACISSLGPLANLLGTVLGTLTTGQAAIENTINQVASTLGNASSTGVGALASGLKQVIDIGVNVQPNNASRNPAAPFKSSLTSSVDQAVPAVAGQTVVRAIEVNLVGDPLASLALASAASGPTSAVPTTPTSTPTPQGTPTPAGTGVPTGVNAGSAAQSAMPLAPLWLALIGFVLASAGAFTWLRRTAAGRP